jgi:glycosyltransferase involved in cell wall biosynthesis
MLTSDTEGLPNAVIEAAACGVPTIATAVGGTPEAMSVGVSGLLVPPGDVSALASTMDRLLSNRSMREAMGVQGRQFARETFGEQVVIDRLLALYGGQLRSGTGGQPT